MEFNKSVGDEIARLGALSEEERDEEVKIKTHIEFDDMIDELFFERRAYVLTGIETDEEIDNYIMDAARKAKAKYETMDKDEMNQELIHRSMKILMQMKQAEGEDEDA